MGMREDWLIRASGGVQPRREAPRRGFNSPPPVGNFAGRRNGRGMLYFLGAIFGILVVGLVALLPFFLVLFCGEFLLQLLDVGRGVRFLLIMLKSLRRNLLRTSLTYLATFILVIIVTLIWAALHNVDDLMVEKTK